MLDNLIRGIGITPPSVTFGPLETLIIYSLVIFLIAGILTEYFTKIIHTKSIITKVSSFLLLVVVMWHLIFVEKNSLADSLLIVFALLLSFMIVIFKKIILWIKSGQLTKIEGS